MLAIRALKDQKLKINNPKNLGQRNRIHLTNKQSSLELPSFFLRYLVADLIDSWKQSSEQKMEVFRISGGKQISGQVKVSGSKNSALPLFAASLLTEEECVLENIPDLSDIQFMAEIIRDLGADIEKIDSNTWKINPKEIVHYAPYELVRKMRASICLLGPLCARLGRAEIPMPGGCVIGNRPIDLHLRALKGLSAKVELKGGVVRIDAKNLKGEGIFLGGRHGSTVTGTANAIMAASLATGTTTLEGCACEPEIVDLCNMLIKMGANIDGLGSHRIQIKGVDRLKVANRVISDRIETATYNCCRNNQRKNSN